MVQNRKEHSKNSHLFIYFPTSLGVSEWVSKQASERKASSVKQVNEWVVQAHGQTDKQLPSTYIWILFWTVVHPTPPSLSS